MLYLPMVNAKYLAFTTFLAYRTVSIKRPGLTFFQKSLLNVPYDRKNEGLNILAYRSYNRMVRVLTRRVSFSIFSDHLPTFK